MLHYNNFFKKIAHHHATSGRCSIFSLCHTLGQWILRPWLFILLHNFRNILFPLEFRFTSGYLFSLYYLFWKKRLKIGSIIEPKTQFSTSLIIQRGHASFYSTHAVKHWICWLGSQRQSTRPAGAGSKAVVPLPYSWLTSAPHSTRPPVDALVSTRPGGHTHNCAIQDSTRFWNCRYSHKGNVLSTPKMNLVRI